MEWSRRSIVSPFRECLRVQLVEKIIIISQDASTLHTPHIRNQTNVGVRRPEDTVEFFIEGSTGLLFVSYYQDRVPHDTATPKRLHQRKT